MFLPVVWSRRSVLSTSVDNASRSSSLMSICWGLLSLFGILCAYSFRTISTYRNFLGFYTSKPPCTKEACPLLTEHRGSRMPNWKISDVHAISANIHNYRISVWIRNLRDFYVLLITAHVVIVYPQKSHRHPALRESALAYTVYGVSAILDAKVRNNSVILL